MNFLKKAVLFSFVAIATSCQVTETIHFNSDGSGNIEVSDLRGENSYMQLVQGNYSNEEIYKDTTYVFADYFKKYNETYARTALAAQNIYLKYSDVKVYKKKSSYEKEFRTTVSQNFKNASAIVDLYKTEDYADNIKNNYALSAEEHYYKVNYTFEGNHFNRNVVITDSLHFKKRFDYIEVLKTKYKGMQLVQSYELQYSFPKKIKSVSNQNAKISDDKKSLRVQFLLTDCMQNPSSTNLEVILE